MEEGKKIRVLQITNSLSGGAGTACKRLQKALFLENIDCSILVLNEPGNKIDSNNIYYLQNHVKFFSLLRLVNLVLNRIRNFPYLGSHFNPPVSLFRICKLSLLKKFDIINLHWVAKYIDIKSLVDSGIKFVWTLHDLNPVSGGLHYNIYSSALLIGKKEKWLGYQKNILKIKKNYIVSPSSWLLQIAKANHEKENDVFAVIPNPIDCEVFKPYSALKSGRKVLFVAERGGDIRKGFSFFCSVAKLIENVDFIAVGNPANIPEDIKVENLGFVKNEEKLVGIYNKADVFVIPSLEDNLPNTIMESLACGTPVVAFNVGGIPEMIEHKVNGYLAEKGDVEDLANGIKYVLDNPDNIDFSANARKKALECYDEKIIAAKYIDLYQTLLKNS